VSFKEAIEHRDRRRNNSIRVESEKILSVPDWKEVNAKVSEIAKVLKEGSQE